MYDKMFEKREENDEKEIIITKKDKEREKLTFRHWFHKRLFCIGQQIIYYYRIINRLL